jgi:hypothetical protein
LWASTLGGALSCLAGSFTPVDAASPPAFTTQSARQIITAAMTAAKAEGSATSSSATTISGQAYSSVTNSSVSSGTQTLRIGPAKSVVRVVGGVVYINDDAAAIQAQFGVSAPQDANRWIAIPSTNSNYARFNSGILLASMLSEVSPAGALKTTATLTVLHTLVVGVTGKPNIHLGLASGTETLYVAATGAHVPIELVASDTVQGQRQTFVITFSNWGKNFHVASPPTWLSISATKLPS